MERRIFIKYICGFVLTPIVSYTVENFSTTMPTNHAAQEVANVGNIEIPEFLRKQSPFGILDKGVIY